MKPRPLLFTADPAVLGGNGPAGLATLEAPAAEAAPAVPAAEATPEPAPSAPAPVASAEPSLLEKVTASIQSKGKLLADRDAATLRATTAEARADKAEAALTLANSELATLRKERSDIQAALVTAQAEKQEQDVAVAGEVAALGFEPAALPAASSAPEETKEQLVARLEKETDNDKRYALAARINAMN